MQHQIIYNYVWRVNCIALDRKLLELTIFCGVLQEYFTIGFFLNKNKSEKLVTITTLSESQQLGKPLSIKYKYKLCAT